MPSESWLPGVDRGCAGCIVVARGERSTRKTQPPAEQRTRGRKTRAQQGLTKPASPVGPAPQTDPSHDHHTRLTTGTVLIASLDLALGN